jgi:hypothetical protein
MRALLRDSPAGRTEHSQGRLTRGAKSNFHHLKPMLTFIIIAACIIFLPFAIWIALSLLWGLFFAATYLISRWWFWVALLIILGVFVRPPKAHSQIPLEQYVQQYFKEKAVREALEARLPKPKPTPVPQLPPYPNILAPYRAPSLLDSMPQRDYEPLYIRPKIVPPLPDPTPLPYKAPKPAPSPSPETLYVRK